MATTVSINKFNYGFKLDELFDMCRSKYGDNGVTLHYTICRHIDECIADASNIENCDNVKSMLNNIRRNFVNIGNYIYKEEYKNKIPDSMDPLKSALHEFLEECNRDINKYINILVKFDEIFSSLKNVNLHIYGK